MRAEEVAVAFSGERLRLARLKSGRSMKEVSELAEVSPAAISQFEAEINRPNPTTVAKLAIGLGVPPEFLAYGRRRVSPGGPDGTHFRSLRSTTKRVRATAWSWSELALDLATALERYVQLPRISVPRIPVSADAPILEMERAADEVRRVWALPTGPVGHMVGHLEAHGVVVTRLALARDTGASVDAFGHWQGERPVVVLTSDKGDAARGRFDAAHELAHLVCHPIAEPGAGRERQANAFAAELLMPRKTMLDVLPRRFDLGAYARLKHDWGVSIAALLYRAKTLEVMSEAAYRRSVVVMSQRYGKRDEPYPLTHFEAPRMLSEAIKVAGKYGTPVEQIAADACLTLDEVDLLAGVGEQKPQVKL